MEMNAWNSEQWVKPEAGVRRNYVCGSIKQTGPIKINYFHQTFFYSFEKKTDAI